MGISTWFENRRLRKDFEIALSNGEYEQAVTLCDKIEIEPERALEARQRFALAKALRGISNSIDLKPFISATQNPNVTAKLTPINRVFIFLAQIAKALENKNYELAESKASTIDDDEGKCVAYRTLMAHYVVESDANKLTIDTLFKIPNEQYQHEELRNLTISMLLEGNYDAAEKYNSHEQDYFKSKPIKSMIQFSRGNATVEEAEKSTENNKPVDERALLVSLVAARLRDWSKIREYISGLYEGRDSTLITFSSAYAYAGKYADAVKAIDEISNSSMKYSAINHLVQHSPLPVEIRDELLHFLDTNEAIDVLSSMPWVNLISQRLYSGDENGALALIKSITTPFIEEMVVGMLIDQLYEVGQFTDDCFPDKL